MLLYSASGAGKTSLLLAGVASRLDGAQPGYETIYLRVRGNPVDIIRRSVRRRLAEVDLPENGSLVDFLGAATRAIDRTLVIVLDQFEEFFMRLSATSRQAFVAELGEHYDDPDVRVKIVLSLREDWLASVNEIRKRIPEIFNIDLRLLPLTREQAHQAINVSSEPIGVPRLSNSARSRYLCPAGISFEDLFSFLILLFRLLPRFHEARFREARVPGNV